MKTIGLYQEGSASPRIEFKIMLGEEDISEHFDLMEPLIELLKNLEAYKKPKNKSI